MTPEERRAQLAAELDTLLDAVVSIGPHSQRDADAGAPEGAFLAELERQLNEKTAELEALDARMNTFSYRFRANQPRPAVAGLAGCGRHARILLHPCPFPWPWIPGRLSAPRPGLYRVGRVGQHPAQGIPSSAAPFRGRRFRLCPRLSVSHSGLAPRP